MKILIWFNPLLWINAGLQVLDAPEEPARAVRALPVALFPVFALAGLCLLLLWVFS